MITEISLQILYQNEQKETPLKIKRLRGVWSTEGRYKTEQKKENKRR